jgi:hypothetical protein
MGQQVVTELVIDASRAESGARQYSNAMEGAQDIMQRSMGAMSDAASAVRDSIVGMGQAATNVLPSMTQLGLGGAGVVATFIALSKVVQDYVRDLADMSAATKRAGLDVESFQKLQFAGSLEGLSNKDFSSGIEKMALRLNDASRNENDLSKLLDANNVKFKDANGTLITTTQLLDKARDLISRAANEQDKIKMAEMLGLTKQWVPLLDQSAEAFGAAQQKAVDVGAVISSDLIRKATDFDREWQQSSAIFSTAMKAHLAELLPFLQQLIDKAQEYAAIAIKTGTQASEKGTPVPMLGVEAFAPEQQQNVEEGLNKIATRVAAAWAVIFDKSIGDWEARGDVALRILDGRLADQQKALVDNAAATKAIADAWAAVDKNAASAWNSIIKGLTAVNDNANSSIVNFNPSKVPGKDKGSDADALTRAIESTERQTELYKAEASAVGLTTEELTQYKVLANLVSAADRAGIDVTGEWGEKFNKLAAAAGDAKAGLDLNVASSKALFDLDTVLLSSTEKRIAQLQKLAGINPDTDKIASQMRLTDAIRTGTDAAVQFSTSLANGLMSNKSLADSLKSSFDSLAQSAASSAIKGLPSAIASGNYLQVGIDATIAIGSKLLGNFFDTSQQKALEQAQLAWKDMADDVSPFNVAAPVAHPTTPANDNESEDNDGNQRRRAA